MSDAYDGMVEGTRGRMQLAHARTELGVHERHVGLDAHLAQQRHVQARLVLAVAIAALECECGRVGLVGVHADLEAEVSHLVLDEAEGCDDALGVARELALDAVGQCAHLCVARFAPIAAVVGVEGVARPTRHLAPASELAHLVGRQGVVAQRRGVLAHARSDRVPRPDVLDHVVMPGDQGELFGVVRRDVKGPVVGGDDARVDATEGVPPLEVVPILVAAFEDGVRAGDRERVVDAIAHADVVEQDECRGTLVVEVQIEVFLLLDEAHLCGVESLLDHAVTNAPDPVQGQRLVGGRELDLDASDRRHPRRLHHLADVAVEGGLGAEADPHLGVAQEVGHAVVKQLAAHAGGRGHPDRHDPVGRRAVVHLGAVAGVRRPRSPEQGQAERHDREKQKGLAEAPRPGGPR